MLTSCASLTKEFPMPVDVKSATDRLMRFLAVEGVTGKEAAIGRELHAALRESGVPDEAIRLDDANTRIPVPTETGNLIVDLPGRGAMHNQPRILFMTHMDTVPLCAGAKPKLAGVIGDSCSDLCRNRELVSKCSEIVYYRHWKRT